MVDPFVNWEWCSKRNVLFADVRWHLGGPHGRPEYLEGHLPGAVFIDLDEDLATIGDPRDGRHPLPSPEEFAAAMSRAGIDGSRPVVAYDTEKGVFAARLVWMLRVLGYEAALLDGGMGAAPAGVLETGEVVPEPADFPVQPWPREAFLDSEDVAALLGSDRILLDARPAARFAGEGASPDPRPGHIPGAVNVPCLIHVDDAGVLDGVDVLRERFADKGITDAQQVISYCGSGVTGCFNILAMEQAGLGRATLYPGSFSAWASREELPVETGA